MNMKSNIPKHPCAGKCSNFKDEQCKTCLVQELPSHKCCDVDFLPGDVVVKIRGDDDALHVFSMKNAINSKGCYIDRLYSKRSEYVPINSIRPATTAEIQANRRLTDAELSQAEVS